MGISISGSSIVTPGSPNGGVGRPQRQPPIVQKERASDAARAQSTPPTSPPCPSPSSMAVKQAPIALPIAGPVEKRPQVKPAETQLVFDQPVSKNVGIDAARVGALIRVTA